MTRPALNPAAPFWVSAFFDFPAVGFEPGCQFWQGVTGFELSSPRGAQAEFATLVPGSGDDYLRVQRLGEGETRIHLDLHVDDPWEAAAAAETAGAELVDDSSHSYVVLRSPAGMIFCFVRTAAGAVPPGARWPHRSRVAEVALDIPRADFVAESRFWRTILAGEWTPADDGIARPAGDWAVGFRLQPVQIASRASGHLHVSTDDLEAEVSRLEALGARTRVRRGSTRVLEAPGGMALCVIASD